MITLPEITVTGSAKVSNDLNKAFKKAFPGAEELRWYKQNKDYLAKFIKDVLIIIHCLKKWLFEI